MEYKFCHHCGTRIPVTAKFCSGCGTAVLRAPDPKPEITNSAPDAVPQELPGKAPVIFTLDSLEAAASAPANPPLIITLDSLSEPLQEKPVIPEPEAQPVPEPETPPVPSSRKAPEKGILSRRGFGRTVLAVLLCIVIFVWSFLTLAVINLRLATSGEQGVTTIESALSNTDLTAVPASLLVSGLDDPNTSLADWMVNKATGNLPDGAAVDPDDLQEFLEQSSFVPFLSQQLGDYLDDIYNGTTDSCVTAAELETLLSDNSDLIYEIFDVELTPESISTISASAAESGALDLFRTEALKETNSQLYQIASLSLSWWVVGILGVILLLLILLLGAVNRSVLRTLGDTGITLMVMSAIWGIGGLFVLVLPDLWNSLLHPIYPAGAALGALLTGSLIPTAAAFGTGFILLLIKVIGKKIVTKSAKKQA